MAKGGLLSLAALVAAVLPVGAEAQAAPTCAPSAVVLRLDTRRGHTTLFTLEWRNYCGPVTQMRFEATYGPRRARTGGSYPAARCDDIGSPSRLRLLRHA